MPGLVRPSTCEHGVSAWDTCVECREIYALRQQADAAGGWAPGTLGGQLEQAGLLQEVYAANLTAAQSSIGTFGSMFDAAKRGEALASMDAYAERRWAEQAQRLAGQQWDNRAQGYQEALAQRAKQMVNDQMARYSVIQAALGGLGVATAPVRRAPATVAAGPPLEAKRGYFDE